MLKGWLLVEAIRQLVDKPKFTKRTQMTLIFRAFFNVILSVFAKDLREAILLIRKCVAFHYRRARTPSGPHLVRHSSREAEERELRRAALSRSGRGAEESRKQTYQLPNEAKSSRGTNKFLFGMTRISLTRLNRSGGCELRTRRSRPARNAAKRSQITLVNAQLFKNDRLGNRKNKPIRCRRGARPPSGEDALRRSSVETAGTKPLRQSRTVRNY